MSQKLILPINKLRLTASWKTAAYRVRFGFQHYGADMVSTASDRTLWASGNGTVVSRGFDSVVGNVVAVLYPGALNHRSGKTADLILRYFHMESITVQAGQAVNKDTRLGIYGKTGSMNMANHLHLEADTDTRHPLFSPTVNSSNFLKGRALGANDRTMSSPLDWLHCKTDAPDYQTYSTAGDSFIAPADQQIPDVTDSPCVCGAQARGE
ncbi:MAG: M23 family metallopeptidase [Oscillospiraceae bacterium]|nr:M23 family metallopeptidase [Oscillospiraceae bacterium]